MTTPNLALPLLAAAQAQKHVTVNEALSRLDGLVQLSVISSTQPAPPTTPAEGDRYIVAAGATGAWAGWDDSVALFSGGAWLRLIPQTGWLAWDQGAGGIVTYDSATGWSALQTGGGGAGGPVTYNPFAKRVEIPLASDFPSSRNTTGAAGSISDDPVIGLTIASTSGTEVARFIATKPLPPNWEVIEFACSSDESTITWGSNGFVLMGAAGTFVTIGVGSYSDMTPRVRILKWNASGAFNSAIQNGIALEGWSAYFRLIHRGSKIIVYHSYDGAAWIYAGTIDETADLGGPALHIGPSANHNTSLFVTYYADADIVPQFRGFVGAGGTAPVLADMTLAQAPSGAAIGMHVEEELLTGLSGASVTSTNTIPDRAIVLAVSTRTVTAITGATSYDCGIAGTPAKFGGSLGIAAGSTNVGVIGPQAFYAPTPIVLTANGGNFTSGDVRIAIQYLLPTAPAT